MLAALALATALAVSDADAQGDAERAAFDASTAAAARRNRSPAGPPPDAGVRPRGYLADLAAVCARLEVDAAMFRTLGYRGQAQQVGRYLATSCRGISRP